MDADLSTLRETLVDVSELLSLSSESDGTQPADLVALKNSLESIISHKELEESKQAALRAVVITRANTVGDIFSDVPDDELPGRQCSLPGWTSRGYFIHQNAIVAGVVSSSEGLRSLRVFLVNPTRPTDIPCDAYVTHGTCPKSSLCRFSHGSVVDSEELAEWMEPDSTLYLQEGQLCLALPQPLRSAKEESPAGQPPLWHHARIRHTDVEGGTCVVEWCSSGVEYMESLVSLPFTHVHPICPDNGTLATSASSSKFLFSADLNSSDDDDYLDAAIETETAHDDVKFHLGEVARNPAMGEVTFPRKSKENGDDNSETKEALGAWESYTRGIGSRLLSKMGYSGTGGLGRHGTGRRLPVAMDTRLHQIVIDEVGGGPQQRPSIDRLIEIKAGVDEKKRRRPRKKMMNTTRQGHNSTPSKKYFSGSIFDFINTKVLGGGEESNRHCERKSAISRKTEYKGNKKPTYKELKVELYNVQREIGVLQEEMARTKQSLRRNEGSSQLAAAAQSRLDQQTAQLSALGRRESRLADTVKRNREDDNLRIF